MRAGSASYPNFLAVTPFPHSLPVAVQDLREKTDRPQNLKLCMLRLNFKALRRSCLAADLVPEGDVWYTTPRSSPSQRCCLAVSRRPGQRGSVGRRGANDGSKVFQLALPGVAPVARAARQEILSRPALDGSRRGSDGHSRSRGARLLPQPLITSRPSPAGAGGVQARPLNWQTLYPTLPH